MRVVRRSIAAEGADESCLVVDSVVGVWVVGVGGDGEGEGKGPKGEFGDPERVIADDDDPTFGSILARSSENRQAVQSRARTLQFRSTDPREEVDVADKMTTTLRGR